MKSKFISTVLLLSITFAAYTAPTKYLASFEEIKDHLLKGGEIKIIFNNQTDCKLKSHSGPIPFSPNTYSINATQFILNAKTGNIIIPIYPDFNPPSSTYNLPASHHTLDMTISPKGEVTLEEKSISVIDYKTIASFVTSCVIGDETHHGLKFIPYKIQS